MTTLRKIARANQTKAINQIKYILRRHNLQHDLPTKTFPTIAAMQLLKTLKLPETDRMELDFAIEDYERHGERAQALDQPISEAARRDNDAAILMQTPGRRGSRETYIRACLTTKQWDYEHIVIRTHEGMFWECRYRHANP